MNNKEPDDGTDNFPGASDVYRRLERAYDECHFKSEIDVPRKQQTVCLENTANQGHTLTLFRINMRLFLRGNSPTSQPRVSIQAWSVEAREFGLDVAVERSVSEIISAHIEYPVKVSFEPDHLQEGRAYSLRCGDDQSAWHIADFILDRNGYWE